MAADPLERVRDTGELVRVLERDKRMATFKRDAAIRQAVTSGHPLRAVAHAAGISFQRVSQIADRFKG